VDDDWEQTWRLAERRGYRGVAYLISFWVMSILFLSLVNRAVPWVGAIGLTLATVVALGISPLLVRKLEPRMRRSAAGFPRRRP
jgi:hypothetical protein